MDGDNWAPVWVMKDGSSFTWQQVKVGAGINASTIQKEWELKRWFFKKDV